MSGGWLTTKKRGRDDAAIEAARRQALAARAARNQTTCKSGKRKTKKTKVESSSEEEDDEDDSIQEFIVNSSDEEEEDDEELVLDDDDEEESSSEEELQLVDNDSGSSEDEENGTSSFLPGSKQNNKKARLSKPSRALQKAGKALKVPRLTVPATKKNPHKKVTTTTTTPRTMDLSSPSSTSYDEFTSPSLPTPKGVVPKNKNAQKSKQQKQHFNSSSSSSSKFFMNDKPTKPSRFDLSLSSSDDDSVLVLASSSGLGRKAPVSKATSSTKMSYPTKKAAAGVVANTTTTTTTTTTRSVLEDTPEPSIGSRKVQQQQQQQAKYNPFASFAAAAALQDSDDEDDKDETLAVQLAIRKSLATTTTTTTKKIKKKLLKTKKPKIQEVVNLMDASDEDEEPLATEELLQEEDSSEGEDDDNDDDLPGDSKEGRVATSVLETATALSAQVLHTMRQWASSSSNNNSSSGSGDDGETTTPAAAAEQGLIVNGALSLGGNPMSSSSSATTTSPSSSTWIAQDVLRRACPGVTLSQYQLIGVNWLALLHGMKCTAPNMGGGSTNLPVNGVLADEMGLGKTVQTIAFLALLKYQREQRAQEKSEQDKSNDTSNPYYYPPHIIVVPVSVLPNWMREFETFAPHMKVVKYHGSMAEREILKDDLSVYLPGRKRYPDQQLDAILVPITYYQKEKSDDRRFLNKFRYNYLVVDEAHMLKNSNSTRYRMLHKVKTDHRLLLTGTPVQNSPQELLNMLCFIMPLFSKGSSEMGLYEDEDNSNISVGDRMLQHFVDAKKRESGDEQTAYSKLKQLFAPFVLRRKKQDVIAQLLPPKKRIVEYVDLDPAARQIYHSILQDHIEQNGKSVNSVTVGEHLFTNLRKAAHHPLLLRTRYKTLEEIEHLVTNFHQFKAFPGEGSTKERVGQELAKFNDFEIHLTALDLVDQNPHRRPALERYILDESALFASAKLKQLKTLLPSLIADGHRVLIFSGWTSCLDLLGCLMEQLGLTYLRMDGSCPSDVRQARIDEFNAKSPPIPVFLLSTRACGLGINLTAADTCIMHDLDFNPFNDLQAEDRCHRIGQKKPVTVYKLVAKDTVDADIYEMQERKSKMNAAIMDNHATSSNDAAEAKKERKAMMQSVVEKFLSPSAKQKPETAVL